MVPILFTIGHSNKEGNEMRDLLLEHGIEILVDVRTYPYSRYNPQFNREAIKAKLNAKGIKYLYRGKNLGGKDGKEGNEGWDDAILELAQLCVDHKVCVMCSEGSPENCHRKSTIQPDMEAQGVEVHHIRYPVANKKNGNIIPSVRMAKVKVQPSLF